MGVGRHISRWSCQYCFNHYAFGCVGDWIYRFIAGLDRDQSGHKHIVIKPDLHESLTYAIASYQSIYGEIVSGWELAHGKMTIQATIRPNTTASVHLPGANIETVVESGIALQDRPNLFASMQNGTRVVLEIGSGTYRFTYPYHPHQASLAGE